MRKRNVISGILGLSVFVCSSSLVFASDVHLEQGVIAVAKSDTKQLEKVDVSREKQKEIAPSTTLQKEELASQKQPLKKVKKKTAAQSTEKAVPKEPIAKAEVAPSTTLQKEELASQKQPLKKVKKKTAAQSTEKAVQKESVAVAEVVPSTTLQKEELASQKQPLKKAKKKTAAQSTEKAVPKESVAVAEVAPSTTLQKEELASQKQPLKKAKKKTTQSAQHTEKPVDSVQKEQMSVSAPAENMGKKECVGESISRLAPQSASVAAPGKPEKVEGSKTRAFPRSPSVAAPVKKEEMPSSSPVEIVEKRESVEESAQKSPSVAAPVKKEEMPSSSSAEIVGKKEGVEESAQKSPSVAASVKKEEMPSSSSAEIVGKKEGVEESAQKSPSVAAPVTKEEMPASNLVQNSKNTPSLAPSRPKHATSKTTVTNRKKGKKTAQGERSIRAGAEGISIAANTQVMEIKSQVPAERQPISSSTVPAQAQVITTPTAPIVKENDNIFYGLEYLIMTTSEGGLSYARQNKAGINNCYDADFEWNSGFRLGMGYNMGHDRWDLQMVWTWLLTSGHHTKTDAVHQLYSTNATPAQDSQDGVLANRFRSHLQLHLNLLDTKIGREFFVSKWLTLHPSAGVKVGWVNQDWRTHATGNVQALGLATVTGYKIDMEQKFWGIGPMIGLDSEWGLISNFNLYANGSVALLTGFFNDYRNDIAELSDQSNITNPFQRRSHQPQWVSELQLGLRWNQWMSRNRYRLVFQAGWDAIFFNNHNRLFSINGSSGQTQQLVEANGDLMSQGVSMGMRFDF